MLKLPTESFDCLSSFGRITYGIKSRQSLDVGLHQLFFLMKGSMNILYFYFALDSFPVLYLRVFINSTSPEKSDRKSGKTFLFYRWFDKVKKKKVKQINKNEEKTNSDSILNFKESVNMNFTPTFLTRYSTLY